MKLITMFDIHNTGTIERDEFANVIRMHADEETLENLGAKRHLFPPPSPPLFSL